MKKLINATIASLLLCGSAMAELTKDGGNGGGAWVCYNKDAYRTIRWTKLVDLFEANKQHKLTIKDFGDKDYQEIIDSMKFKLFSIDSDLYQDLIPFFDKVNEDFEPVDMKLKEVNDVNEDGMPQDHECLGGEIKYAQLANYKDEGPLLVNEYLFNHQKFAPVDRAALIFHEVIYAFLRDRYNDEDSKRARAMVGYIFSTKQNSQIKELINNLLGYSNGVGTMEFVKIAKGSAWLGSCSQADVDARRYDCTRAENGRDGDELRRFVTIDHDFEMMTTEVTQAQYFEIMDKNPSKFKESIHCSDYEVRKNKKGEMVSMCPNNPVEQVSWDEVTKEFLPKLNEKTGKNYRLPTEAEWEFAARAGSQTAYSFGDDAYRLNEYAIFSVKQTAQVGPYRNYANNKNGNGLYDMHGNVWEMTSDYWTESPQGGVNPRNPEAAGAGRVFRGGSWYDSAAGVRSAFRLYFRPGVSYYGVGFRPLRTLP